jgi:hypothetical protein
MAITRTAIIDDDGSGKTGTVIDNAWKQELYNQIDGVVGASLPDWIDIPFVAGNFFIAQGTGTWTASGAAPYAFCYTWLSAYTALVHFNLNGGTITGSPVGLGIRLPTPTFPGFHRSLAVPFTGYQSGGGFVGILNCDAGATAFRLLRDIAGTPYPAGPMNVAGQVIIAY